MDFDTIIKKLRTALYGVEVREYIAQAMEYVKSTMESGITTIQNVLKQAQAARDAASTSASNAASSASAASTSASNAASSASAAKSSQTAAASSASAAKTSETNAKTSETNAASSASAAKTSEENSANAAMKALKEAADSGAYKGEKGDKGDKGDTGPAGSYSNATQSTAGLMSAADKVKLDDLSNAITASGSNYVRFSDGTQICWSDTYTTMKETVGETTYTGYGFAFSVPFSSISYSAVMSETAAFATSGMLSSHWPKATTYVTFGNAWHSAIAIGRWE
nr:MAG TPA: tail fiber protein [Caudoviricetes sp.]